MSQRRRPLRLVAATAIVGAVLAALFIGRFGVLRAAGSLLVADDPIRPADAIVVAVDADGAGVLEAADLVRAGISSRVALFTDLPDEISREFTRRGVPDESDADREVRQLHAMGVEHVELITPAVAGTEDEGVVLPQWCDRQHIDSVVIVTSADHTRRLRRVMNRSMKSRPTVVMVRRARHSNFDPDQWWRRRGGVRTEIVELEKLLLDFVRHPVS